MSHHNLREDVEAWFWLGKELLFLAMAITGIILGIGILLTFNDGLKWGIASFILLSGGSLYLTQKAYNIWKWCKIWIPFIVHWIIDMWAV